jgi:hypothetical protein
MNTMTTNELLETLPCVPDGVATMKPNKVVAVLPLLCVAKEGSNPSSVGLPREKRILCISPTILKK